jgi:hypothetical protein
VLSSTGFSFLPLAGPEITEKAVFKIAHNCCARRVNISGYNVTPQTAIVLSMPELLAFFTVLFTLIQQE